MKSGFGSTIDGDRLKKIFLIGLIFFLIYCNRGPKAEEETETTPASREKAENFVLVDSEGSKKNWVLRAEQADNFEDSVKIYGVAVEFYDKEGEYSSTLTSDSGVVYSKSGDMRAIEHVKVTSRDSTVLKTDYLEWDNKRQKICTESNVRITQKNSIITGKGMESDPNLEHIEIKENFNAVSRDVKEDE
jgi:LPS export ABC transporter protein LptC